MTTILTLLAGAAYLIATLHIAREMRHGHGERRGVFLVLGTVAVVLHGVIVSGEVFVPAGVELGLFSAGSLVGLLLAIVAIITSLFRPVTATSIVAYPTAFTLLLVSTLFKDQYTPRHFETGVGIHIVFSLLAYAVLGMATVHAGLLATQNRLFRTHRLRGLLRALPPIMTMEAILFELIALGFVLLTIAIGAGMFYVENFFAQHLVHKTVLTIAGWLVLGAFLVGHRVAGWRGQTAVRWTISSFALLVIAFFGSKIVLELILHKS